MALKKRIDSEEVSTSTKRAEKLFSKKEKKILTTFSIEPSFKAELEDMFSEMGLGWAAGIRFALRGFYKQHEDDFT